MEKIKKSFQNLLKKIKKNNISILKILKKDKNLSIFVFALLIALILGSILVGFIRAFIIVFLITTITYFLKLRKKRWIEKYSTNKLKMRRKKKIKNSILIIFLVFSILCIIGVGVFCYYVVDNAPEFEEKKLYTQEKSVIYDSEGSVIAELGSEKREKVSYNEISQVFIDAVIATEDSRYLQHNGFDLPRFAKAVFGQITGDSGAGGASTITMQVVKNTLTSANQNLVRKFTDIYLAIFILEKKYTKEEIFELYVNIPYLGSGSYGVEQASQTYFGKSISEVNLSEAALLAGLFQSPGAYDPYNYPEVAEERRKTVLYLMRTHGYITKEEEKLANSISVEDLLISTSEEIALANPYQSYIDIVINEIKDKTKTSPYETAMEVYTTLIKSKQDALNTAVENVKFKDDVVQTGIAMTDVNTGAIVAIYGGRNRSGERTFNYATDINRQIGSTAKPVFDYAPAVEYLNWNELTTLVDEPWTYSDGVPVKNWNGTFMDEMTIKEALGLSRNIPALKAFQTVYKTMGYKKIVSFVQNLGMSPEVNSNGSIYETHAIGAYNGESPLSMAAAYAAFANGGYYIKPYSINKIVYKSTGVTKDYTAVKKQAMEDSTAYIITDILRWAVTSGLSSPARVTGIEIAAKTGTTNYDEDTIKANKLTNYAINDSWLIAYSPSYSVGIWYGYDTISNKYYNTSTSNYPLIKSVVKALFTEKGEKFKAPKSVTRVEVEKDSNPPALPSNATPSDQLVTAWFKVGSEPTDISPKYSSLNNVTNLQYTYNVGTVSLTWEHEISESLQTYLNKNADKIGVIGYNVYKKTSTGITLLGYTADNNYTINNVFTDTTYLIKATYSLSQTTESTGTSITINTTAFTIDSINPITITFGDSLSLIPNNDDNIIVMDLTNTEINTYTKVVNKIKNSSDEIITEITAPGIYYVNYKITYADKTITTEYQEVTVEETTE